MTGILAQATTFGTGLLLGQAPDPAPSAVQVESVWDFIVKGGWMMVPIGLCSLLMLTVVAERLIALRRSRVIPRSFHARITALLQEQPGDVQEALELCRRDGSPLASVFAAALRYAGAPIETIKFHVQETGQREVLRLRRHLRALSVIAAVSPLLGLLGTIFGMITAFQTVATSGDALGKTELLAGGIYEAMITTAAGLIVAIPAMVCYHWLSSIVQRRVMDIDEMSVAFVEQLASPKGDHPAAHADAGSQRDGAGMRIA